MLIDNYLGIMGAVDILITDNIPEQVRNVEEIYGRASKVLTNLSLEELKEIDSWFMSLLPLDLETVCAGQVDDATAVMVTLIAPPKTEKLLEALFENL